MAEEKTLIAAMHDAWDRALLIEFNNEDVVEEEEDRSGSGWTKRKADAALASRTASAQADNLRRSILYQIPETPSDAMTVYWHAAAIADAPGNEVDDLAADAARDALGVFLTDFFAKHDPDFRPPEPPGEQEQMLRYARIRVAARTKGEI